MAACILNHQQEHACVHSGCILHAAGGRQAGTLALEAALTRTLGVHRPRVQLRYFRRASSAGCSCFFCAFVHTHTPPARSRSLCLRSANDCQSPQRGRCSRFTAAGSRSWSAGCAECAIPAARTFRSAVHAGSRVRAAHASRVCGSRPLARVRKSRRSLYGGCGRGR
jgi:hypothetical protein